MPDHLRGIWLRHAELDWLEPVAREQHWEFRVVKKPFWLAGVSLEDADPHPLGVAELRDGLDSHFLNPGHPVMISALRREGDRWEECERLFVVPDRWPSD